MRPLAVDTQLGKLAVLLRDQSGSCKTESIPRQNNQTLTPALHNYPQTANGAIPSVSSCTTDGAVRKDDAL
jgi:hypothetical protein